MHSQARFVVKGRVQGVSFRAYAAREANRLGLTGFVRNLPNGEVEIVARGPESAVRSMEQWARTGPPGAKVTGITVERMEPSAGLSSFEVRY